ncbi:hypothetical protein D3C87_1151970 [compost metagenome]
MRDRNWPASRVKKRPESYTRLAIIAGDDPLFKHYHQPNKGQRMDVILPEGPYADRLTANATQSRGFLVPFSSDKLVATLKA